MRDLITVLTGRLRRVCHSLHLERNVRIQSSWRISLDWDKYKCDDASQPFDPGQAAWKGFWFNCIAWKPNESQISKVLSLTALFQIWIEGKGNYRGRAIFAKRLTVLKCQCSPHISSCHRSSTKTGIVLLNGYDVATSIFVKCKAERKPRACVVSRGRISEWLILSLRSTNHLC